MAITNTERYNIRYSVLRPGDILECLDINENFIFYAFIFSNDLLKIGILIQGRIRFVEIYTDTFIKFPFSGIKALSILHCD